MTPRSAGRRKACSASLVHNRFHLTLLLIIAIIGVAASTETTSATAALPENVWMDPRESAIVQKYMRPHCVVLEYGSGASTISFSKHVAEYHSVEHVPDWCKVVKARLQDRGLYNVYYHCVPKNETAPAPVCKEDELQSPCSSYAQFKDYIETPARLGTKFDVVLVDGRARAQCAIFVLDFLRDSDSVVILHDWNRRIKYHTILQVYDIVEQQVDSNQPGGGGLVVLKPKKYKMAEYPSWWWN